MTVGDSTPLATLRHDVKPQFEEAGYLGLTTIFGICIRAGGDHRASAELKLFNERVIKVRLKSRSLAVEVGKRLYKTIGLEGEAEWSLDSNEILKFTATKLTPYNECRADGTEVTVLDAIRSLSEVSRPRWDNIDPEQFVRDLREE